MEALWARSSPAAASDIVDALATKTSWDPRTIKTLLNRLVRKKAVAFRAAGKRYLYRAAVTREACVRQESRSFIARVFQGAVGPMLVQLLADTNLSADEVEQMRKILDEKGRQP